MNFKFLSLKLSKKITNINFRKYKRLMMILYKDSGLKVKVSKIKLNKFSGQALKWQTFWNQFESTIHSKESLSDIDKFTYLKGLLTGSAGDCISGLSLTFQNHKEAANFLKERYANPQGNISAHMESLMKLPSVRDINDVTSLQKSYNRVESSIQNLKSVGINPDSYTFLLTPLLTETLLSELQMIVARKFFDEIWNLEDLLNHFKQELHARERCSSATVKTAEKQILDESTTSSFVVGHDNVSCVYCLGQHASSKCTKITSVEAKRDLLRKFTRCFVCLKKGNVSKNCDSKYKCNKCSSRHHISICGIFEEKTAVNGSTNKKCILLQIANAQISGGERERERERERVIHLV